MTLPHIEHLVGMAADAKERLCLHADDAPEVNRDRSDLEDDCEFADGMMTQSVGRFSK